jgi:Trp operon repressor
MEHLSSAMEQQQNQEQQQQVQWRRDKVQELCSKGYSQREISQILQVGVATAWILITAAVAEDSKL